MNKNLKILALGGLHEVGKNCYIIEKKDDLIIVDCGIKFLNNGYNLANGMIPNFAYLKDNKERIKGLFITHGHEDHIGGIPYLLEEIGYHFPVYGSTFALAWLKKKLGNKESLLKSIIFSDDTVISTAEFRVSFFRVTHSIPGSFVKLAEAGKKGVDLLLSDSTNAEVPGTTPSERKIISRLEVIISQTPGRAIVTSFSSNIYRLKKMIEIAKKYDKKILLLGSSLNKYMEVFRKVREAKAVLSRLAHQIYPDLKIVRGDTIILTSSPIMDNRYNLEAINNRLMELGATIYENNKEELLHASGHACQEDLKLMLTLVKPRYFMPFHGDFRMLKVHGFLAQATGVPAENIFVCQNGEIVQAKEKETSLSVGEKNQKAPLSKPKFFLTDQKIDANPSYVFNQKVVQASHGKKTPTNELKSQIKEKMREMLAQDLPKSAPVIVTLVEEPLKEKKTIRRQVDDYIYGGGPGMLLKIDCLVKTLAEVYENYGKDCYVILLSPQGKRFTQKDVERLVPKKKLVFICGHYEGLDERILNYIDEQISIGDFVTSGGEMPALLITETLIRALPGVLSPEAYQNETFQSENSFDFSAYTRPALFEGQAVPAVLLSGHQQKIQQWRRENSQQKVQPQNSRNQQKIIPRADR
ncbi:14119_t:CDS:2 [Funneliformis geosporum]|nr:14119_t:CDS:2 [Funneliformis geosporum]